MALLLDVKNLTKTYPAGSENVQAVRGVNFQVEEGQITSIMGPSGCGKSTLLHLLGGMQSPTSGEIWLSGKALQNQGDEALSQYRQSTIGFVFQFFHLLPHFDAVENVELPLLIQGLPATEARDKARDVLDRVGLGTKENRRPSQLSGGEQQRVAIARALVHGPKLLLADEPTGNLDMNTGKAILDLIRKVSNQQNCAVLMATHSREAAEWGDMVIMMRDGQVNGIYPVRK
jgi:putative ABC transport system ATP-binding protein